MQWYLYFNTTTITMTPTTATTTSTSPVAWLDLHDHHRRLQIPRAALPSCVSESVGPWSAISCEDLGVDAGDYHCGQQDTVPQLFRTWPLPSPAYDLAPLPKRLQELLSSNVYFV